LCKKGTFTGALADKQGKFEYANNGTIFLDEIGDMPFKLQSKLLRVLQQKRYTPLGSNVPIELNVRVVAATNRDLKKLVEEGKFRGDLYFRLNVFEISLPPLREKRQDLPLLYNHFISYYNKEMNKCVVGLSKEAEECFLNYNYPGNIRELKHIIEHAINITEKDVSDIEKFDMYTCVDGEGVIVGKDFEEVIKTGDSYLIPATLGEYKIKGTEIIPTLCPFSGGGACLDILAGAYKKKRGNYNHIQFGGQHSLRNNVQRYS